MTHYQAVCGCNWTGKVYSNTDRADGNAIVHIMLTHRGEPAVTQIRTTDAPLNGHIYAPGHTK